MRCNKGFLLFESSLLIAIMMLVLGATTVGVRAWFVRHGEISMMHRIEAMLTRARLLAMRSKQAVFVCGSSDGYSCDNGWSKGWLCESKEKKRFYYERVHFSPLRWHAGQIGSREGLVFSARGHLASGPGHFSWQEDAQKYRLTVSLSGHVRLG